MDNNNQNNNEFNDQFANSNNYGPQMTPQDPYPNMPPYMDQVPQGNPPMIQQDYFSGQMPGAMYEENFYPQNMAYIAPKENSKLTLGIFAGLLMGIFIGLPLAFIFNTGTIERKSFINGWAIGYAIRAVLISIIGILLFVFSKDITLFLRHLIKSI